MRRLDEPLPDEDERSGAEVHHLIQMGGISVGGALPWEWDDDTHEEMADELHEALAKKRPVGFAAWPEPVIEPDEAAAVE